MYIFYLPCIVVFHIFFLFFTTAYFSDLVQLLFFSEITFIFLFSYFSIHFSHFLYFSFFSPFILFFLPKALTFKIPFDIAQLYAVRSTDFSDLLTIFTQTGSNPLFLYFDFIYIYVSIYFILFYNDFYILFLFFHVVN